MGVQRDTDKIGLFASFQDSPSFPPQIKAEIAICLAVCFEQSLTVSSSQLRWWKNTEAWRQPKWQSGVSPTDQLPLGLRAAFIVQLGTARSTCNHHHTGVSSSLDKGNDSSLVKHRHFDVDTVRGGAPQDT